MKRLILITVLSAFSAGSFLSAREVRIRVVTQPDKVYLYHTKNLPSGYGFNVYRSDNSGGEFTLLTETPVKRAGSGSELQSGLGERYLEVRDYFEAATAGELWLMLQSRMVERSIGVSLFPELAESMGMLFVDETAPIGREVTYRIEFVNLFGNPYDETISKQLLLEPQKPIQPTGLEAENDGTEVTLRWFFAGVARADDDKVIRFMVYRIDPDTGNPEIVNEEVIIRNNAYDNHLLRFNSPDVNITESYFVTAVDITGQQSDPSELLVYDIVDKTLPDVVYDVSAAINKNNRAEIVWAPSDDERVEGYHIYRSADLSVGFERVTELPLPPDQTLYVDDESEEGNFYFYYVTAINSLGGESDMSAMAMVRIPDITPPPPPRNFTGEFVIESETVELQWDIDEITPDFKSFIILRRREDDRDPGAFNRVDRGNFKERSFSDRGEGQKGFHEGGIYRYVIYSADHDGNYSDTLSKLIEVPLFTPPEPPSNLLAVNDRGIRVNLNWNVSPSPTVMEYIIYRGSDKGEEPNEIVRVKSTETRYRDENVYHGTEYFYSVSSIDRAGNTSEHVTRDTILFRSTTPPRAVTNLQAAEIDGGVLLKWDTVPGNIAGYRVYRSNLPTGVFEPVHQGEITENEFFDEGGSSSYWYNVNAVDTSENESRAGRAVRPIEP